MAQLTNSHKYDDIIGRSHPVSAVHPPMTREERAAQFLPFSALTGYEDAISETQRLTENRKELDENKKAVLDERIRMLMAKLSDHPRIRITYFLEDDKKEGGEYITVEGSLLKISEYEKKVQMMDQTVIPISDIIDIEGDFFADAVWNGGSVYYREV